MRVFARFLIVIVLLVGSFLVLLLGTELFQRRQSAAVLTRAGERREVALSAAVEAASAPLAAFAEGLRATLRETSIGTAPDAEGRFQIGGSAAAIFVEGPQGASEFRVDPSFPAALAATLREAAEDRGTTAPFFVTDGARIAECRTDIVISGDAQIRFVVSRLWDAIILRRFSAQAGGTASVDFVDPSSLAEAGDAGAPQTRRFLPLNGTTGTPIAWLAVNFEALTIEQLRVLGAQKMMVLLAFSFVVMVVLAFALTWWIARPMGLIGQSLAAQDAAPLRTLLASQAEFGQFAQLIKTTLDQKAELGREIEVRKRAEAAFLESVEERLRLSRDLHDGVIQSIYAAGLTLEGIKATIESDPAEARRRLDMCLHGLNDTIAELRRYLLRSGEAPTRRASMHDELHRMADTLRSGHNTEIALDVVEEAAAKLDSDATLQLMLIGREAITNALRHAGARTVAVTLRPEGDRMVVFEVRDDGSGLPASKENESRGHGLANMTRRAEELGGSLEIESRRGVGTRVRVEIPVIMQSGLNTELES
jgi:signal transduction histidine kinase